MADTPRACLLISNVVKDHNVAALLRSADAFGVEEVCIVGRRRIASAGSLSVGASKFVRRSHFESVQAAADSLRERGYRILGVEIDDGAVPIEEHPFTVDTAFVLGNEGEGLSPSQRRICDGLVRIRQYGHTASLNVHVAGAIVLHHFALWAGLPERPIEGAKFAPREDHGRVPEGHERMGRFRPSD